MTHDPHSGDWQNLDCDKQMPRYRAIAALVPAACDLLDVGCGEAILADYLPATVKYLGLEPSSLAVASTRPSGVKVVHMLAEEAIDRISRWDRIVFNEVLYYLDDPIATLRKYSTMLMPSGRIIISIYQKQNQRVSWRKRVKCFLKPAHPRTNLHCTEMVMEFLLDEHWKVWSSALIPVPQGGEGWMVTEVSP